MIKACKGPILIVLILLSTCVYQVRAIPTFHSGGVANPGNWERLLDSNTTIFWSQADFSHYPWEAEALRHLAENGIKVNFRIEWWGNENLSAIDYYYNSTLLEEFEEWFSNQITHVGSDYLWAVTLSEEQPGASVRGFLTLSAFQHYNYTYHSETGFWLRYDGESEAEIRVRLSWMEDKVVWLYNHIYDYVKTNWPHILVFQFFFMPPAIEWPDITRLKQDAHMGDFYYAGGGINPFALYQTIRSYKTVLQETEYHIHLWGQESWPPDVYSFHGGFEQIRRDAWIAYLSGVDALGWFTWHYLLGTMWDREDVLGKRLFVFLNRMNIELSKVPVFKPRPKVLTLQGWYLMEPELVMFSGLGLFNEWDTVYPNAFLNSTTDLSQYEIIVANDNYYSDDVIQKLNDYVESGGNLVLLGGFGGPELFYGNETRSVKFLSERNVNEVPLGGHIMVNISKPNLLDLGLQYNGLEFYANGIENNSLTADHHVIGDFFEVDENETLIPSNIHPLVLYRNSSNSNAGWTLYWGLRRSLTSQAMEYEDPVEVQDTPWKFTRFLYRNVSRAFATNLVHLNSSITKLGQENMIITQAKIDSGTVMAGISNYYQEERDIIYTLDLDTFDFSPGSYWVHSLDMNTTLGQFDSKQNLLEVPISIVANGTRLLLISQEQQTPAYWINIFPDIPTEEDVADLWPPLTSTTTTTTTIVSPITTTTVSTSTTTTTNATTSTPLDTLLLASGIIATALVVVVLAVSYSRKRRISEN